jgi:energy-coupling factor transporter ATP-binding protein EcfA2
MKIKKFNATSVHGYLSIDINFFPDLTFITGVNGSGKTSALRLLMALLVPDIEEKAYPLCSGAPYCMCLRGAYHLSDRSHHMQAARLSRASCLLESGGLDRE